HREFAPRACDLPPRAHHLYDILLTNNSMPQAALSKKWIVPEALNLCQDQRGKRQENVAAGSDGPAAVYLVCLSATLLAPYDSGLILASKPLPVTMPTTSRIKSRVSPPLPTSRWISTLGSTFPFQVRRSTRRAARLRLKEASNRIFCRRLSIFRRRCFW